ncbi:MAG: VOC family protein [Gammaproteobacteria bacterium]|nr:VOC family protein [Gammaproteobacteria bacterium]
MFEALPVSVVIAVSDLERARSFYTEKLGLKVVKDNSPEELFCEAGDGARVLLYHRPDHEPCTATIAGFVASDVVGAVADLSARGIQFEDYDFPGLKTDEQHVAVSPGGTKSAWFKDPDGNILAVGER